MIRSKRALDLEPDRPGYQSPSLKVLLLLLLFFFKFSYS